MTARLSFFLDPSDKAHWPDSPTLLNSFGQVKNQLMPALVALSRFQVPGCDLFLPWSLHALLYLIAPAYQIYAPNTE